MSNNLASPSVRAISPRREMGAYEALWLEEGASSKTIADKFRSQPGALPSDFVNENLAEQRARETLAVLLKGGVRDFGVRIHGTGEYPARLRDARHPLELLYYQGDWCLTERRSVAVVGTREPSPAGYKRAAKVGGILAEQGFVVISGLARGIDTAALTGAIEAGGKVIGVIGTPLGQYYPPESHALQDLIAAKHLLISQVPVLRYGRQRPPQNRFFFPERNVTMSALSEGTVIIEAGETSGTLTQARAAVHQRRKLFILDSCFERGLGWPARFERSGAIRAKAPADIFEALG